MRRCAPPCPAARNIGTYCATEDFHERLAAHEYLWTRRKHDFVLLQAGPSPDEMHIVDISTGGEVLLIHDDVLANAVIERMKESQVPVVTEDELKHLVNERQRRPPGEDVT